VASWSTDLKPLSRHRKKRRADRDKNGTEDGQTCPRCGDLFYVASARYCPACRMPAQVSHFAFVNPGGPKVPDIAKAKRYGITRLYWEARDPQISAGLFLAIRERGMEVGIMRDPSWDQSSAIDLARELDADLGRLGSSNSQCAVLADIEYHDPAYITAFLGEWRALRPHRVTGWTFEPLQGGWMDHGFGQGRGSRLGHALSADLPRQYVARRS
jgi:hypothetical protein